HVKANLVRMGPHLAHFEQDGQVGHAEVRHADRPAETGRVQVLHDLPHGAVAGAAVLADLAPRPGRVNQKQVELPQVEGLYRLLEGLARTVGCLDLRGDLRGDEPLAARQAALAYGAADTRFVAVGPGGVHVAVPMPQRKLRGLVRRVAIGNLPSPKPDAWDGHPVRQEPGLIKLGHAALPPSPHLVKTEIPTENATSQRAANLSLSNWRTSSTL